MASASTDPAAGDDLRAPVAAGWRILRRIAVGGMAEVFLVGGARGPRAVLKRMLPHHGRDPELVRAFAHEAELGRALATPGHPALVRTLEHGEDAAGGWILLEHVDGATLAEITAAARRAGETVPLGVALHVAATLLDALAFVHAAKDAAGRPLGIVHRDVTPENLLVARDGAVKLGDLGIARSRLRDARTRTGVIKGKLAYLAPEQATGSRVDARADLYAAAIILWELVTGRPWLDAADEVSLLRAAEDPPFRSPSSLGGDPRLDPVLARALARFPEERFPTAAAFRAALAPLLAGEVAGGAQAWLARRAQALSPPGPDPSAPGPAEEPHRGPPRAAPLAGSGPPREGPRPARATGPLVTALTIALLGGGALVAKRAWRPDGTAAIVAAAAPAAATSQGTAPVEGAAAPPERAAAAVDAAAAPPERAAAAVDAAAAPPERAAAVRPPPVRAGTAQPLATPPPATPAGREVHEPIAALRARLGAARASLARRGIASVDLAPDLRASAARAEAALAEGNAAAAAPEVDTFVAATTALRLDEQIVRRKLDRVGARLREARARGADTRAAEARAAAALQSFLDRRYEATDVELDAILAALSR
ncbi:protein kinase domain-containing protein [Sorangium sp. So ce542]|uniref:serine/threonine-protein kinase n=1 Tax=Sorangium sp. So ce542 TaxID=3133316 RepID=UPI003F5F2653